MRENRSGMGLSVSVLINNYNYDRYLKECIDSVLEQNVANLEIVVVDDGSTDESHDIIRGYGDRIIPVLKENGGQASCFNVGFAASTGSVIYFLDSDDKFYPGKIAQSLKIYETYDVSWLFDRAAHAHDGAVRRIEWDRDIDVCDFRARMRSGVIPHIPVPTSGLSFRRDLIDQILPMPVSEGITLSDNYLKFTSSALAKGAVCNVPMTYQRIHGDNRYTGKVNTIVDGRIMFETGYQIARNFPDLSGVAVKLISGGLATPGSFDGREQWRQLRRCVALRAIGAFDIVMIVVLIGAKRLRVALTRKTARRG